MGMLVLLAAACRQAPQNVHQAVPYEQISVPPTGNAHWPQRFGWGRAATGEDIRVKDIDVRPDGKGLPAGSGTVARGRGIYALKCAACHGTDHTNGTYGRLFPHAVTDSSKGQKLIGNYWPYATTLYDYINRAMPFNQPGSLSKEEVYSVTAYLLHMNGLWAEKAVLSHHNLPAVQMPALERFVPDNRRGGPEIK